MTVPAASPPVPYGGPPRPLAPPPPPGPGVRPPFVAPPTDGSRRRRTRTIVLSISAAVVALIVAAGGIVGLYLLAEEAIRDEARTVVTRYLTAIKDHDYPSAYRLLCPEQRDATSLDRYTRSFVGQPALTSFDVGEATYSRQELIVDVAAVLRFDSGTTSQVTYEVLQDQSTGEFKVCDPGQ